MLRHYSLRFNWSWHKAQIKCFNDFLYIQNSQRSYLNCAGIRIMRNMIWKFWKDHRTERDKMIWWKLVWKRFLELYWLCWGFLGLQLAIEYFWSYLQFQIFTLHHRSNNIILKSRKFISVHLKYGRTRMEEKWMILETMNSKNNQHKHLKFSRICGRVM